MVLTEWDSEFHESKTHNSKEGFEFAKQNRFLFQNVSPFPLLALFVKQY
jgi:hypothetical protein